MDISPEDFSRVFVKSKKFKSNNLRKIVLQKHFQNKIYETLCILFNINITYL